MDEGATTHGAVEMLEPRDGAAARAVAARLGEFLDIGEVVAARRHAAVPALPVQREADAVPVHARALEEGAHCALHAHGRFECKKDLAPEVESFGERVHHANRVALALAVNQPHLAPEE